MISVLVCPVLVGLMSYTATFVDTLFYVSALDKRADLVSTMGQGAILLPLTRDTMNDVKYIGNLSAEDVRLVSVDHEAKTVSYSIRGQSVANWSGPRAGRWGFAELPRIGSRVCVNFNGLGLGTVTCYFVEQTARSAWIGCAIILDKAGDMDRDCHAYGIELISPAGVA